MARSGTRRRGSQTPEVRAVLVEATIEALRETGFAGTSARAIAQRAGVSQALIFYHFGSIDELLLAALDETSRQRMSAYRAAMETVTSVGELFEIAGQIFRDDLDRGHLKVLAELIAASSSQPSLGSRVAEQIEPWIELTEDTLRRALSGSSISELIPTRDLATGIVSLYLGLELITHLRGDRAPAEALFETASSLAGVLNAVIPPTRR
jgi:AcrR family transcriptional regulator